MYLELMKISQEALESGYYETAYHVLCAAMHYAHALADEDGLKKVEETAIAQLDWIDNHAEEHKMSSQASIKRSGVNLYHSLRTQTHANLLMVQRQNRLLQMEQAKEDEYDTGS